MERQIALDLLSISAALKQCRGSSLGQIKQLRRVSQSTRRTAIAHPLTAAGPPPSAPLPAASEYGERIDRRRRQAEMLKQGREIRAQQSQKSSPLKKRFWKEVHVKESAEGYQILLDSRPVRTPSKSILTIPASKPHLAHAIALEWDSLVSAQQALKNHLIPLTSIASRAEAIIEEEAAGEKKTRQEIVRMVMRYLDTDTLLCWAPTRNMHDAAGLERHDSRTESLRNIQVRTAQPIISHLTSVVWPGVEIKPVLDSETIIPQSQPEMTKNVIRGWISGLPAYELAALERGVLASKSLLVATRLLLAWSEEFRHLQRDDEEHFGIEEAAEASSLEVNWQTGMWGEVEDTHDVEKEDLRRQLGSVILLVSGHR